MRFAFLLCALIRWALAAFAPTCAEAQDTARGAVRILLPFADDASFALAQLLAPSIGNPTGQPVVAERRPGATGRIAPEALKNAAPDGTTLLLAPVVVPVLAPLVFRNLSYDPVKDFAPVAQIATFRYALIELHRAGRIRILATSGAERSPLSPTVPTFREQGLVAIEGTGWIALYARAGTPKPLVDRLSAALVATLRTPGMKERVISLGGEATGTTPEELAAIMVADTARWAPIIKASGFVPE